MATVYLPPDVAVTVFPDLARKAIPEVWLNPGADDDWLIDEAKRLGLDPIVACSIMGGGRGHQLLDPGSAPNSGHSAAVEFVERCVVSDQLAVRHRRLVTPRHRCTPALEWTGRRSIALPTMWFTHTEAANAMAYWRRIGVVGLAMALWVLCGGVVSTQGSRDRRPRLSIGGYHLVRRRSTRTSASTYRPAEESRRRPEVRAPSDRQARRLRVIDGELNWTGAALSMPSLDTFRSAIRDPKVCLDTASTCAGRSRRLQATALQSRTPARMRP
jgi:hypothetical protein